MVLKPGKPRSALRIEQVIHFKMGKLVTFLGNCNSSQYVLRTHVHPRKWWKSSTSFTSLTTVALTQIDRKPGNVQSSWPNSEGFVYLTLHIGTIRSSQVLKVYCIFDALHTEIQLQEIRCLRHYAINNSIRTFRSCGVHACGRSAAHARKQQYETRNMSHSTSLFTERL